MHLEVEGASPRQRDVPDGENLARAIWLYSDVPAPVLCGGLGRCGACRVRLSGALPLPEPLRIEREILGDATDEGWRLACRHTAGEVAAFSIHVPAVPASSEPKADSGASLSGPLRLAVDMGTTSVHWQALDARGDAVASGQMPNPQAGAGADVMSRLAAAASPSGRRRLSELSRNLLRDVMRRVASPDAFVEICLAANTAMSAIFLDLPVDGLIGAPYRRPLAGGETVFLPELPPVWLPPQPAPFVGGDVAAGMAWALHAKPVPFPFLLADMGTNGEFVLALDPHASLVTSVPLGPALEGMGLSCGGVAGGDAPGVVTSFALGPQGLTPHVPGGGAPRCISGTGVLSLLDVLRKLDILTPDGTPGAPRLPLASRLAALAEHTPSGWRLPLFGDPHEPGSLYLTAEDVEAVLKVRAAFVVAVDSLLEGAGLRGADLGGLLLAGSLGMHAPLDALEHLGFLPPGTRGKTLAVGNASLSGAALLLARPDLRPQLVRWSEGCRVLDVTGDPRFMERFARGMRL